MNEPDKRDLESMVKAAREGARAAELDLQAQRQGLQAGMSLLPQRIDEVDNATKSLPFPVSGTTYSAMPNLQSFSANSWTKVQEFTIAPPGQEKTNAQLFLTCTALIRYGGSLATNYILSRVKVNGQTFPVAPVMQTGFSVAGGSYAGVINVSVEVLISDPGGVTNDSTPGRENSIRTFTMAVWN